MNKCESEQASEQVNAVATHCHVYSEAFEGLGCDDWCLGVRPLHTSPSCMGPHPEQAFLYEDSSPPWNP